MALLSLEQYQLRTVSWPLLLSSPPSSQCLHLLKAVFSYICSGSSLWSLGTVFSAVLAFAWERRLSLFTVATASCRNPALSGHTRIVALPALCHVEGLMLATFLTGTLVGFRIFHMFSAALTQKRLYISSA